MARKKILTLAPAADSQPSGSTHPAHPAQRPKRSGLAGSRGRVSPQPTEQTTTKTGDISPSSSERILELQALDELRTAGAKITKDIRALDCRAQPHHVLQTLEERGLVRRVGKVAQGGKRHTVWGLTAAGLRHLES